MPAPLLAADTYAASYQMGRAVGALIFVVVVATLAARAVKAVVDRRHTGRHGRHRSGSPYGVPIVSQPVAPAYPAPAYSAPAYSAPAYSAPAYSAPAYPAPAYSGPTGTSAPYAPPEYVATASYPSGPGWAAPPLPPPAQRPGMRLWVKVGLGIIALLFAFGAVATLLEDDRSLSTPNQAAGLQRLAGGQYDAAAKAARSSLSRPFEDPVLAFYGAPGDEVPTAMVMAAKADHADVDEALAGVSKGMAASALGGVKLANYPAGKLGGTVRCGVTGKQAPVPMTVCVWVDDHTFGMVVVYHALPEAAPLALSLREAVER
jgi:hypothetical protein